MSVLNTKKLNLAFLFAWACWIAIGIVSYLSLKQSLVDANWVKHTLEMINKIAQIQTLNNKIDTAASSFVSTSQSEFLDAYKSAQASLGLEFQELKVLTQDNDVQQSNLNKLQVLIDQQTKHFDKIVAYKIAGASAELDSLRATDFYSLNLHRMNVELLDMNQVEKKLLSLRLEKTENSTKLVTWLIVVGCLFACACLWLARSFIIGDLKAKVSASNALKESQERLTLVSNATEDCVWDWNLLSNSIWWNDGIRKTYGYAKEDVGPDGDWWISKIHPDDLERVGHDIHEAIENPNLSNWSGEYRFRRSDDSYCSVLDRGIILRDAQGKGVRMLGSMLDMTEQKALQEELIAAREKAIESSRLKSEFLANMSHEIRTPMNGVIGMTGLLFDTALDPMQLEYAETIRGCAESLLTVINDILDFSKIEAGKLTIENSDFDLRMVVESCMELLAPEARKKGLEFLYFIDSSLPTTVIGDAGRMRQMIINLLSNALKFTQIGEILLHVKADQGDLLRFEIIDTGIGISEANQAKLFQAFIQADGSTARKYGGTGLGLAISKHLVTLMGGDMGVTSKEGHGSTFWFTLPLPRSSIQLQLIPQKLYDLKDKRCLVVDDNETNRRIVHHQIISWGMSNGSASSPIEALRMLRQAAQEDQAYDIAVLDMHMPEMSGVELALEISQDPLIAGTRLILMSSLSKAASESEMARSNISAHLMKPVRQSHLYECFVEVLSGKRPQKSVPKKSIASETPYPVRAQPVRILIAEDNPINQRIALSQVAKLGYKAEAVGNGIEVLEACTRIHYDLILMDCQMPEMDGYEATRCLRKIERAQVATGKAKFAHVIVIAMTANAVEGDREKCLEAGMDDYIGKPVKVAELKKILELWTTPQKLKGAS